MCAKLTIHFTYSSYQFNPHLLHPETTTNVLTKSLTVFPSPAFSLALSLLPAHTQPFALSSQQNGAQAAPPASDFTESIQKLSLLSSLLESAQYALFWQTLNSDDLYADLVADVSGFEELVRVRIAVEVGKAFREINTGVLASWLDLRQEEVPKFVKDVCEWTVDESRSVVVVSKNAENEAKGEIRGEKVGVEMFRRVVGRGFEEPA